MSIGSPSNPEAWLREHHFETNGSNERKLESKRAKRDEGAKTRAFPLPSGLTPNNSMFVHHNDFIIGEAANTMGMARQSLAQNIIIQMRERR
jgi:hypothetical protein